MSHCRPLYPVTLGILILLGCAEPVDDLRAPVIEALRPNATTAGSPVTVVGRNFGRQGSRDLITLGGIELVAESWSDRAVLVRVPETQRAGSFDVVIRASARVSAPTLLEVLPDPEDFGVGDVAP